MSISRGDLINSKFHAVVNRKGEDVEDVLFLKPSAKELEAAAKYTIQQCEDEGIETAEVFVGFWVNQVKKDLGL